MGRWTGDKNPRWSGGRHVTPLGYVKILAPNHPRADRNGTIFEHIVVAESVLGDYLPEGAMVHHIDENPLNNAPDNLLICKDAQEHKLIHVKLRAFRACGHEDWRKCAYCKQYDAPENLYIYPKKQSIHYHRACSTAANKRYVEAKKLSNL